MQLLDDDGTKIQYNKNTVNKVADELFPGNNSKNNQSNELPNYGKSFLEWTLNARPIVDGRENILKYLPYMQRVYDDANTFVMYLWARQTTKSTLFSSRMGYLTTTKPGFHDQYLRIL